MCVSDLHLFKFEGIEPERLFTDRDKPRNLGRLSQMFMGIGPERPLDVRSSLSRDEMLKTEDGIGPVSILNFKSRPLSLERFPICFGIFPWMKLKDNSSISRLGRLNRLSGNVPVKLLFLIKIFSSFVSAPIHKGRSSSKLFISKFNSLSRWRRANWGGTRPENRLRPRSRDVRNVRFPR